MIKFHWIPLWAALSWICRVGFAVNPLCEQCPLLMSSGKISVCTLCDSWCTMMPYHFLLWVLIVWIWNILFCHFQDVHVPVCPLCNNPVPVKKGEIPDVVGEHIDRDCNYLPGKKEKVRTGYGHPVNAIFSVEGKRSIIWLWSIVLIACKIKPLWCVCVFPMLWWLGFLQILSSTLNIRVYFEICYL